MQTLEKVKTITPQCLASGGSPAPPPQQGKATHLRVAFLHVITIHSQSDYGGQSVSGVPHRSHIPW